MDFVLETINQLFEKHFCKLHTDALIYSNQGSHCTSTKFIKLISDKNLRQSMSRRGNCWDNAPQESFFGHMKDEINIKDCNDFESLKKIIDDYMNYYNNERYQWNLKELSPSEFYKYTITEELPNNY